MINDLSLNENAHVKMLAPEGVWASLALQGGIGQFHPRRRSWTSVALRLNPVRVMMLPEDKEEILRKATCHYSRNMVHLSLSSDQKISNNSTQIRESRTENAINLPVEDGLVFNKRPPQTKEGTFWDIAPL
jgi:hypothetical protein